MPFAGSNKAAQDATACELVTDDAVERMLAFERKTASVIGTAAPGDCEAMIAARPASESYRALMLATVVDAVEVAGSRATATVHTSTTLNGVLRTTRPRAARAALGRRPLAHGLKMRA